MVLDEEWKEWKQHPVTKDFKTRLDQYKASLARGAFEGSSVMDMAAMNVIAGKIKMIIEIIEMMSEGENAE